MKKIVLFAALGFGLTAFSPITELPIGADMPKADVKLTDISGKQITLKEAQKKNGLLVMFSCNTCPFVLKNQARTKAACTYALEHQIGVVLLNSNEAQRDDADSYNAMKTYAKAQGYEWYYAVDKSSELADAFGATRTPENFLFNAEGKLVYHGAIDDNPEEADVKQTYLQDAMNAMLNGKEITPKTSRSVGCGIKRL